MDLRAAFFDFDLTLGHMSPSHFTVYVQAAHECGIDVTEKALRARPLDDAWGRWMTPEGALHLEESASEAAFREVRVAIATDRLRAAGAPEGAALRASTVSTRTRCPAFSD
jgi:beta-phosphoglucomutase-like phosphatase (HAD superfamily)